MVRPVPLLVSRRADVGLLPLEALVLAPERRRVDTARHLVAGVHTLVLPHLVPHRVADALLPANHPRARDLLLRSVGVCVLPRVLLLLRVIAVLVIHAALLPAGDASPHALHLGVAAHLRTGVAASVADEARAVALHLEDAVAVPVLTESGVLLGDGALLGERTERPVVTAVEVVLRIAPANVQVPLARVTKTGWTWTGKANPVS